MSIYVVFAVLCCICVVLYMVGVGPGLGGGGGEVSLDGVGSCVFVCSVGAPMFMSKGSCVAWGVFILRGYWGGSKLVAPRSGDVLSCIFLRIPGREGLSFRCCAVDCAVCVGVGLLSVVVDMFIDEWSVSLALSVCGGP